MGVCVCVKGRVILDSKGQKHPKMSKKELKLVLNALLLQKTVVFLQISCWRVKGEDGDNGERGRGGERERGEGSRRGEKK